MDYNCTDIPMRLDIRHQPLNFDIYLSQVIEIPRTCLEDPPYDFRIESEALQIVDRILERTQSANETLRPVETVNENPVINSNNECSENTTTSRTAPTEFATVPPPPSCPTEVPLTPIKSSVTSISSVNDNTQPASGTSGNLINLGDFEDTHYNPFDHLELETIDELRELDLVFQASYANQANNNQLQTTTNDAKKA